MIDVVICDAELKNAAANGMDAFAETFYNAIINSIGGGLTQDNLALLNSDQITLVAYFMLREEVMDGGFIQMIHNGLGRFIFVNPFDKALAQWGLTDMSRLIKKGHKLYNKYKNKIEVECDDDEFMAMFEQMPEFDDLDDDFVANEEQWTSMVACYIDQNIDRFATVVE
ncbi:MAG: DMP19 family protein [Prevotella sp.]